MRSIYNLISIMLNPVPNGSCSGFLIASTINNVLNFVVNIQVFQSKGTICNHVRWMDMDVPSIHILIYRNLCHEGEGRKGIAFRNLETT
jgi:hypothetical protein